MQLRGENKILITVENGVDVNFFFKTTFYQFIIRKSFKNVRFINSDSFGSLKMDVILS